MNDQTMTEKAGGRKALAFYAALACCFTLALLDKAHAEVLGLIDTLFFIYAGANVMTKRQAQASTSKNTQEKTDVEK
jgi:hypothetical protein